MKLVRRGRPAMATWFEVWLGGDDEEHLEAVAEAALDEVTRVEHLLSRYNPAAEVARINREAHARPIRVTRELLAILVDARSWHQITEGFFDILWVAGPIQKFDDRMRIDEVASTVRFLDPAAGIDLGGYGKGYALDATLRVIDGFGVTSAFLHGGTSSALARGQDDHQHPWCVAIRDPFAADPHAALDRVTLHNQGFASSAVFGPDAGPSDILDPRSGVPQREQAAVSVVAASATEAEVYSTALLAMGRAEMGRWWARHRPLNLRVAWVDRDGIEWIGTSQDEGTP